MEGGPGEAVSRSSINSALKSRDSHDVEREHFRWRRQGDDPIEVVRIMVERSTNASSTTW